MDKCLTCGGPAEHMPLFYFNKADGGLLDDEGTAPFRDAQGNFTGFGVENFVHPCDYAVCGPCHRAQYAKKYGFEPS